MNRCEGMRFRLALEMVSVYSNIGRRLVYARKGVERCIDRYFALDHVDVAGYRRIDILCCSCLTTDVQSLEQEQ